MTAVRRYATVRARLVDFRWEWAEAERDAIAAHWGSRLARQPTLFDGRVLMICAMRPDGDVLDLDFFETTYSRLLAHIDRGFPDPKVRNGFAMGALRSRDGAFVLGEMAPHTANAGRLYFPAGTPDMSDLRPDGTVDLAGSIGRELEEETGLVPGPGATGPGWALATDEGRAALLRTVTLDRSADEIRAAILQHVARQAEPELSDVVLIRRPEEIRDDRMPAFLPGYLRWAFAADEASRPA